MEKIKVGDVHIAFEQRGTGPPLVLLHGALCDSRSWRHQLDVFSQNFKVIVWDAPGCGRSSDPPETFTLSDYSKCLAALIEALDMDRPHLLGLSFGGGLALDFYRNYPDIPKSLVLVSAYAGWAGSLPPETVAERLRNGIQLSEMPPEVVVNDFLATLFTESTPKHVIKETADIISEFHPAGMRAMLRAFAQADLRNVLTEIRIPTLLVYGDIDQRSPLHVAEALHDAIPASRLVVIEGAGHLVNAEAPKTFNAEVQEFLTSISLH